MINVGIIGFGTVGAGVVKILQKNASLISKRIGTKIKITAIADLDIKRDRGVKVDKKILTTAGLAVCTDPKVDIVVELVGGLRFAEKFIKTALENGKHVVTANKALLAEKGEALFRLAEKNNRLLLFEAAVGGAIPIMRTLKTDLAGEKIEKIYGILNGTCNYILTKLSEGEGEFAAVLKEAQKKGFAESDPTLDISGKDAAHKIILLAMLAWGTEIDFKNVYVEGITKLDSNDFAFAKKLKRVIKLVAIAKKENGSIELRVHPTLLPKNSALAKVDGVTNAISICGQNLGECLLSGLGAGSLPTATAVVGEASRTIISGCSAVPVRVFQPKNIAKLPIKKMEDIVSEYYLRIGVEEKPGVIRDIAIVLAKYGLNIRDILQLDFDQVPIVIILDPAKESVVRKAVKEIDKLKCASRKTVVLRVEE